MLLRGTSTLLVKGCSRLLSRQAEQGQDKSSVPAGDRNSTPEQRGGKIFGMTHTYLPWTFRQT